MSEEIEYVELRLKIPKPIVDFLRAYEDHIGKSAEQYLEYKIVDLIRADLECSDDCLFFNPMMEVERRGLNKIFKAIIDDVVDITP